MLSALLLFSLLPVLLMVLLLPLLLLLLSLCVSSRDSCEHHAPALATHPPPLHREREKKMDGYSSDGRVQVQVQVQHTSRARVAGTAHYSLDFRLEVIPRPTAPSHHPIFCPSFSRRACHVCLPFPSLPSPGDKDNQDNHEHVEYINEGRRMPVMQRR